MLQGKVCNIRPLFTLMLFLSLGALLSWGRGQDINWDLLNYHIYNPWSLLNHRPYYFASGIQGYFYPYLDVPYYWLAMGPLHAHPQALQALCGIPYGILLFELYLLANTVARSVAPSTTTEHAILVWSMVLLAGTGATTWIQVGTTTNEITTAAVVLCGLVILVNGIGKAESRRTMCARTLGVGACIGLATGLKLTAGIYVPAVGVFYLLERRDLNERVARAAVYSCAAIAAFCVAYGPWGLHMYIQTGNPFFPMFNNIFHSSMADTVSAGRDIRFLPRDVWQWIFYPFFWVTTNAGMVNETPFNDARFAAAYIAFAIYFVSAVSNKTVRAMWRSSERLNCLIYISVAAYAAWLVMFSILRYAIVVEALASIALIAVMYLFVRLFSNRPIVIKRLTAIIASVSVALWACSYAANLGYAKYGKKVYDVSSVKLPEKSLVIMANQPMGFIAPLLGNDRKDLVFAGIPSIFGRGEWAYKGFYRFGLGNKLREVIRSHINHLYVAYYADKVPDFPGLSAFGVVVDYSKCQSFRSNISETVEVCKAEYAKQRTGLPGSAYRLVANVKTIPGMEIDTKWKDNACVSVTRTETMHFDWVAQPSVGGVSIYASQRKGSKTLFSSGGQVDQQRQDVGCAVG